MINIRQLRLSLLSAFILLMFPVLAFAQGDIQYIIGSIGFIIGTAAPVVAALALLYFFWGLAKFILNADNEQARSDGKQIMVWGIIALFVIVAVWGLVAVLVATFGVNPSAGPAVGPLVPGGYGALFF